MSLVKIYPYKAGSQSARAVAQAIGADRIRLEGSRYRQRARHRVINWGNSNIPNWLWFADRIWNHPANVAKATDKLETLKALPVKYAPEFTDNREVAIGWLSKPLWTGLKNAVVCRTILNGHSGNGIVLGSTPEEIVSAPLYTRYIPKQREFRVHVGFGTIIDIQEKRRRTGFDFSGVNRYIRNYPGGWVFCRSNIAVPDEVISAAKQAIPNLGLHFGAVDIGYHSDIGPKIYEVNTAPGLSGQTLQRYKEFFTNAIRNVK